MQVMIQWHWFGRNRHGLLFYDCNEFMFANRISRKKAEQLIKAGTSHGS